ncbi:hypothetical protein JHK86_055889 [Glycine max]|nr:hypothetical protein JHK86_055889 [Glycine max]
MNMPNIARGKIQMEISETMRIDTFITQECDSSNDFDNRSAFQRFLCKGIAAFGFSLWWKRYNQNNVVKQPYERKQQESPHFTIPSSPSGNEELLSTISYCTFVFTFTDPSESPAQRDSKRLQLTRLVSILKSSKKPVHEKVLGASSGHDLSQPLQATPSTFQPFFFPHRIARRRRPHLYILIPMPEDPMERESLKNVYHKIYSEFISDRSFRRKSMTKVAERALYVWNNEQFVKMALIGTVEVFTVIVEGMEKNLKSHWSKSVRQLTESVKVMLEDIDPDMYSKSLMDMEAKESMAHQEDIKRKKRWERIELEAAKNQFLNPQRYIRVSY